MPIWEFSWWARASPVSAPPEPLRKRGFAPDVVEQEMAWADPGAGIYLPANAARALRALGLQSAVAERGSLIPYQRLCDHRGRLLADIDLAALCRRSVRVWRCTARICTRCWHFTAGWCRSGWVDRCGGSASMTMRSRLSSATKRPTTSDLVIGADGIHSTTRRLTVGAPAIRPVGTARLALRHRMPPDITTWTVMLGRDVTFLAAPIGRGRVYCYVDAPTDSIPSCGK